MGGSTSGGCGGKVAMVMLGKAQQCNWYGEVLG